VDPAESSSLADRTYPSVSGAPVEALPIATAQDRTLVALADGQVDGSCGTRHQRDLGGLVALADDAQDSVAALEAEVLDVRGTRFTHAKAVEAKQHSECRVVAVVLLGGEQEHAELGAVEPSSVTRVDLRASDVLGRVRADAAVDVSEAVEPADRRQPSVDRGGGETAPLHPGPEQLDVRAGCRQHIDVVVRGPLEEPAQVVPVGLEGPSAVAGEERRCCELHLIEPELILRVLERR
jgi:hypothetical protein